MNNCNWSRQFKQNYHKLQILIAQVEQNENYQYMFGEGGGGGEVGGEIQISIQIHIHSHHEWLICCNQENNLQLGSPNLFM